MTDDESVQFCEYARLRIFTEYLHKTNSVKYIRDDVCIHNARYIMSLVTSGSC